MRNMLTLLPFAALTLAVGASPATADLVGASYDFSVSSTGTVDIVSQSPNGGYTDPSGPFFCIGPANGCDVGSGVSSFLSFADVSSGSATITFTFFGSTFGSTGSFAVDLNNWSLPNGEKILGITYGSGNFSQGDFSSVSFNGSDAVFTGTSNGGGFSALGGRSVVFDVTLGTVPEASTWAMLLAGFAGLGLAGSRASRKAASIA